MGFEAMVGAEGTAYRHNEHTQHNQDKHNHT